MFRFLAGVLILDMHRRVAPRIFNRIKRCIKRRKYLRILSHAVGGGRPFLFDTILNTFEDVAPISLGGLQRIRYLQ